MRRVVPLRLRPLDVVLLGFFAVNLLVISYVVDLEQLVIADPESFTYPVWPPPAAVDLVHWWGHHYDPTLMVREPWWKATIWIDQILFGPFYVAAIWALAKGREWIRVPAFVWSGLMFANVTIIMSEEYWGAHPTPDRLVMTAANLPWWTLPVVVVARFARSEHPFTEEVR